MSKIYPAEKEFTEGERTWDMADACLLLVAVTVILS